MFKTKTVLHPTDFSPESQHAFQYAYELADRRDAELHLLHVATFLGDDPLRSVFDVSLDEDKFYKEVYEEADEKMKDLIETVEASSVRVRRIHSRGMAPAPVITDYAEDQGIDVIVTGTEGRRGVSRLIMGSVANEVVRNAPCTVLTVPDGATQTPAEVQRVLTPTDLSEFSRPLLRAAQDLTASFNASLDLLHVVEPLPFPVPLVGAVTLHDLIPDPTGQAKRQLDRLVKTSGGLPVSISTHVAEGHAAITIVEEAEKNDADLIIMASHGRTGLERVMLGSVTARVVRRASCPVCVVRVDPESNDEYEAALASGEAGDESS